MSWHLFILDVQSFRGDDCDTDHHLVVWNNRERLSVNKWELQNFDVKRSNPKELNNVEFTEQCQDKISDRFVASESEWGHFSTIFRENMKISAKKIVGNFKWSSVSIIWRWVFRILDYSSKLIWNGYRIWWKLLAVSWTLQRVKTVEVTGTEWEYLEGKID